MGNLEAAIHQLRNHQVERSDVAEARAAQLTQRMDDMGMSVDRLVCTLQHTPPSAPWPPSSQSSSAVGYMTGTSISASTGRSGLVDADVQATEEALVEAVQRLSSCTLDMEEEYLFKVGSC
jgi:hypothetical protein